MSSLSLASSSSSTVTPYCWAIVRSVSPFCKTWVGIGGVGVGTPSFRLDHHVERPQSGGVNHQIGAIGFLHCNSIDPGHHIVVTGVPGIVTATPS